MLTQKIFQNFKMYILDTLFPVYCLGCRQEGHWLCKSCSQKIFLINEHVCGVCEHVYTPWGQTCPSCKKKAPLDALLVATTYQEHIIRKAIHLFKYRFVHDFHRDLGDLLTKQLLKSELPLPDVIIPVPLHARRLRWRGFNQSALLAKHIAKNLLPADDVHFCNHILVRKRSTAPQMEIEGYKQRQQNISGAFIVLDKEKIANKTILLVDDVCTTGSTLFECAKVLKHAGAKRVLAVVIARQETKNSNA